MSLGFLSLRRATFGLNRQLRTAVFGITTFGACSPVSVFSFSRCTYTVLAYAKMGPDLSDHIQRKIEEPTLVKSLEDKRFYRGLELKNGMKILLISDPSTDKSACALDVNVGHLSDPRELPGLAHFCEHMLFLGTKKFPEENDYQKFLSAHGGSCNAYTACDHTNYFFDVAPEFLAPTLDRFAQFFLSPLFTESATEREICAVDSEHNNNVQNDARRKGRLRQHLSEPSHDYNKFGTGNKHTLLHHARAIGLEPREELLKFHRKHYSANVLRMCVLGKESLDELTELVVPLFADVENKQITAPTWEGSHPYPPERVPFRVNAVPVKDLRGLNVSFPIEDLHPYYKSNPGHYLGHLLGHEGPGSLLSELKRRGWVNTLSGGPRLGAKGFGFFAIDVDLSPEGLHNVEEIVYLIFAYINLLRSEGPLEWVHRECEDLQKLSFQFKDKESPQSYAMKLATDLHDYPLEEVLFGPYIMNDFNPELIKKILACLLPENMIVSVASKEFEGKEGLAVEPYYGVKYEKITLDPEFLRKCAESKPDANLYIPAKNEFIPTDFKLFEKEPTSPGTKVGADNTVLPELIVNEPMSRIWYKQDQEFHLPKCCCFVQMSSPVVYSDPLAANLTQMFVTLLHDALTELVYNAELAGLRYSVDSSKYGLSLSVRGYNEKLHVLLERVVEKMVNFTVDPKRFEILKELYVRNLRNFEAEQAYQQAVYYTTMLLSERAWSKEQLLEHAVNMTPGQLQEFIPRFLSALHFEAFVHGNTTREGAEKLIQDLRDLIAKHVEVKPVAPEELLREREVMVGDNGKGGSYLYEATNKIHANSALEVYIQTGLQDSTSNMLLELLCQIQHEPCFDRLRTKEQLGYIVFSGTRRSNGSQGVRFIIQGERPPEYVEYRLEMFLKEFSEHLKTMSEEEFEQHKKALAVKRLEKPKRLSQLASKYWSEITIQYHFDRDLEEVARLKTISKKDLIEYFEEFVAAASPKRSKLTIHVKSTQLLDEPKEAKLDGGVDGVIGTFLSDHLPKPIKVTDFSSFKSSRPLYPRIKPYIEIPPPLDPARAKL